MAGLVAEQLLNNELFYPMRDESSGVLSYVMAPTVAPIQQSFYFTNPSLTVDGRYLWFYTAYPPAGGAESGRTLGVCDLHSGHAYSIPESQFRDASPWIDPVTGTAYWCWNYAIYSRGPQRDAVVSLVNELPESVHQHRYGKRMATHLTPTADGKSLFIDAHLGREWIAGTLPLDGGAFELWQRFERCFNHAQANPADPDLALIAQDWWIDVASGERHTYDNRIWTIRRGEKAVALLENDARIGHEWWSADGQSIWFVHYEHGTERVNLLSGKREIVWSAGTCHSHASSCGAYLVGDIGTYTWADSGCRVAFYNIETAKEINIASQLPSPMYPRGDYHIDPHPQFLHGDQWVAYTTTVNNAISVALVEVSELIAATS